jgi:hypothetical protein
VPAAADLPEKLGEVGVGELEARARQQDPAAGAEGDR